MTFDIEIKNGKKTYKVDAENMSADEAIEYLEQIRKNSEKKVHALERQINTFVVLNYNGDMHSLTMTSEEGKPAKIVISGDIKMLERRWDLVKKYVDNYFEEQK